MSKKIPLKTEHHYVNEVIIFDKDLYAARDGVATIPVESFQEAATECWFLGLAGGDKGGKSSEITYVKIYGCFSPLVKFGLVLDKEDNPVGFECVIQGESEREAFSNMLKEIADHLLLVI